jgi:uncharacterized protein (TIGR02597 family)
MKRFLIKTRVLQRMTCALALTLAGSCIVPAMAEQYPAGFVRLFVPAQSDAVLSIPMLREPVFRGKISAISGNKVTLSGTPAIPSGTVCALLLTSGAKEGMHAKITAQSAAVVTVAFNPGDNLTGVAAGTNGTEVYVVPYWTPASLVKATAPAGIQILGIENAGAGINLSFNRTYKHTGGGAWQNTRSGTNASAAPLPFHSAFVLRNTSDTKLTVTVTGSVPMRKHRLNLATLAGNTPQDIPMGYGSPVPETLNKVGLGAMANGDQILGFDNAATGYNKSASQLLIMEGGVWKDQITGEAVETTFQLKPGYGYIYRKAATSAPSVTVWTGLPVYLTSQP